MANNTSKTCLLACSLAMILSLAASCTASQAQTADHGLANGLPAVSSLDLVRPTSAVQRFDLEVDIPLLQNGTSPQGTSLNFISGAGHTWAVYRMGPIEGDYQDATAMGSGPLWLMAADYGAGHWRLMTELDAGTASISLTDLAEWLSPAGYTYLAVVCPAGSSGTLNSLTQDYWTITAWDFSTSTTDTSLAISWSSGMGDSYDVYRSTVSGDTNPYLVAHLVDTGGPKNEFTETIGIYPDTWLPVERDSGINGDATDFYPSVAPGVEYYYTVVPIDDILGEGEPSPEVNVQIGWGTRRSVRRELPSSTGGLVVFADQLLPTAMTGQQVRFCALNMAGTQKIYKWHADDFREYNPDFLVLGYHLGLGAGNIGNVHGNGWDNNADWPYVDAHEGWFIHMPDSMQPGGRVLQQDWNWYGADPASGWQDYLGANLLQMLGEDHYDGWFVDSNSELWNTTPDPWWPDGMGMFEFWTPRVHSCLQKITQRAAAHPLQPYVIPNAGAYVTTVSDIKYYGSNWACDGIMIEGYGRWNNDNGFGETDWLLECNRILDHQQHGLATILQCNIWIPDSEDRLFQLGTYYLVKGEKTYINWLGDDGLDTVWSEIGQWYPEWDWISGAAVDPNPQSMGELADQGVYRRDYANGFVVVNPTGSDVNYNLGAGNYLYMTPNGGGNIDDNGNKQGSLSWLPVAGSVNIPPQAGMVFQPQ